MDPTDTSKIAIKIGDAEFSAEGPTDIVNAQFQAFLDALQKAPAPRDPTPGSQNAGGSDPSNGEPDGRGAEESEVDAALLDRVFSKDKPNSVSLKVLPKSAADGLVLLLYGFKRLRDVDSVTGSALMASAIKSGIKVQRIDRVIDAHAGWITTAGMRRGKRYGLNNRGVTGAEKMLATILG